MPLLAICRGFQEMNVAFGGTLWQKLHEVDGLHDHREDLKAPLEEQYGPAHEVELTRGGVLQRLAGTDRITVNSLHSQGVQTLGRDLDIEARAPDGVVEAFRVRNAPAFAVAVQWHPEWQVQRATHFPRAVRGFRRSGPRARPGRPQRASSMSVIQQFFKEHGISEVEAIIPDMAGVARGKIMPAEKFAEEEGMRLPESIFLQTVTGEYPDDERAISPSEIDIVLKADPNTIRVVPWAAEPTAQVIHDSFYSDGTPGDDGAALRAAARAGAVRAARLGAGGRARARVLPGRAEHRFGLPAEAAGRPLRASRDRPAVLLASPRSTSSIRCSTTCTRSARRRTSRSTR